MTRQSPTALIRTIALALAPIMAFSACESEYDEFDKSDDIVVRQAHPGPHDQLPQSEGEDIEEEVEEEPPVTIKSMFLCPPKLDRDCKGGNANIWCIMNDDFEYPDLGETCEFFTCIGGHAATCDGTMVSSKHCEYGGNLADCVPDKKGPLIPDDSLPTP